MHSTNHVRSRCKAGEREKGTHRHRIFKLMPEVVEGIQSICRVEGLLFKSAAGGCEVLCHLRMNIHPGWSYEGMQQESKMAR